MLQVVKDAYQGHELGAIGFTRSEYNPADALSKAKKSDILNKMLQWSVLSRPIEQWVNRSS